MIACVSDRYGNRLPWACRQVATGLSGRFFVWRWLTVGAGRRVLGRAEATFEEGEGEGEEDHRQARGGGVFVDQED
jgi:hypothetical protein